MIKKFIVISLILLISQNFSAQALDSASTSKADEASAQRVQLLNILDLPTEVQTYMLQLFFQDIISSNSFKNQEEKFEKVRSELNRISLIDKQFYSILSDSKLTINIIKLIAQKESVSEIEAAMLLGTESAIEFIKKKIEEKSQDNSNQVVDELNNLFIRQLNNLTNLPNNYDKQTWTNIKFFLKFKINIDVNIRDVCGETPLNRAVIRNKIEIVKLLLAHNDTDVHVRDGGGQTPLNRAVIMNNIEIIKLLLAHGANVNAKDNDWAPLNWAAFSNKIEIVKLLLAHNDINVNAKHQYGYTVLMLATLSNNIDVVKLLLDHNDINVYAKDNKGNTALDIAKLMQSHEIIKLIKEHIWLKSTCAIS